MPRKKKKLPKDVIEAKAGRFCSVEEIASFVGADPDTVRDNYKTELDNGRNHARRMLRSKQYDLAMAGNVTMLIWLGKQYLGQSEKISWDGEGENGFDIGLKNAKKD